VQHIVTVIFVHEQCPYLTSITLVSNTYLVVSRSG